MEKRKLYPIGKAAEICKVSPRALRYYEEKGLIRPDEISSSHYRYYSTETLRIVQLIRYYIDEGFSLQETQELLKRDSFDQLENLFRIQMSKTREEISLQYQRLDSLTAWYSILREGRQVLEHHDDSVTVKHVPSSMYFYMDAEADLSAPHLNADLETEYFSKSKDHGHTMVDMGGAFHLYFGSIEVRLAKTPQRIRLLQTIYPNARSLHSTTQIPGYTAICTYHIGPADTIGDSYQRAIAWAEDHNFQLRQDAYERCVLDIYSTCDESKFVTQILLPVQESERRNASASIDSEKIEGQDRSINGSEDELLKRELSRLAHMIRHGHSYE